MEISRLFSDGYIADALANFPPTGPKSLDSESDEDAVMSRRHQLKDSSKI